MNLVDHQRGGRRWRPTAAERRSAASYCWRATREGPNVALPGDSTPRPIRRILSGSMRSSTLGIVGAPAALMTACSPSASAASSACTTLDACCATAGAEEQSACFAVPTFGSAVACAQELASLGACETASAASGTGCTELAACCAEMSGAAATSCEAVVMTGVATTCAAELSVYASSGSCPSTASGPTGGCAALAPCCAGLGAAASACEQLVSAGDSAACSAELSAEMSAGACGGTPPGGGVQQRGGVLRMDWNGALRGARQRGRALQLGQRLHAACGPIERRDGGERLRRMDRGGLAEQLNRAGGRPEPRTA